MENQTHNKVLSTNDTNLVEFIDSRRQENLESHDMNYKSLIENNEINGLTVGGFKSGDPMENQTHNKVLSTNDTNLGELIDTRQQGNLESHDTNNKSLVKNIETVELPVG